MVFLEGDGGDDDNDVMSESHKTLACACWVNAWVVVKGQGLCFMKRNGIGVFGFAKLHCCVLLCGGD